MSQSKSVKKVAKVVSNDEQAFMLTVHDQRFVMNTSDYVTVPYSGTIAEVMVKSLPPMPRTKLIKGMEWTQNRNAWDAFMAYDHAQEKALWAWEKEQKELQAQRAAERAHAKAEKAILRQKARLEKEIKKELAQLDKEMKAAEKAEAKAKAKEEAKAKKAKAPKATKEVSLDAMIDPETLAVMKQMAKDRLARS